MLTFFRVYHSMRYVHGKLVLRLNRRPSPAVLETIQTQFADILAEGRFEICGQLSEEKEEIALPRCRGWSSSTTATIKAGCGS